MLNKKNSNGVFFISNTVLPNSSRDFVYLREKEKIFLSWVVALSHNHRAIEHSRGKIVKQEQSFAVFGYHCSLLVFYLQKKSIFILEVKAKNFHLIVKRMWLAWPGLSRHFSSDNFVIFVITFFPSTLRPRRGFFLSLSKCQVQWWKNKIKKSWKLKGSEIVQKF